MVSYGTRNVYLNNRRMWLLKTLRKLFIAASNTSPHPESFRGYNRTFFSNSMTFMETFSAERHPWIWLLSASGVLIVCFEELSHECRTGSSLTMKHIFLQYQLTPWFFVKLWASIFIQNREHHCLQISSYYTVHKMFSPQRYCRIWLLRCSSPL